MDTALERAAAAIGGVTALGRALKISPQAISQWEQVPPLRVLEVERLTGIPRGELRPDLYPSDEMMPGSVSSRKRAPRQQRAAE